MKRLLAFCLCAILVCLASSALAAGDPNLVGTWEGTPAIHGAKIGYHTGKLVVTITEQRGNMFHGTKTYHLPWNKTDKVEAFSGSISSSGHIMIVDHDDGYMIGNVLKTGEIELQYGHPGEKAIAVYVLLKKK